jgi:hypothetical protein
VRMRSKLEYLLFRSIWKTYFTCISKAVMVAWNRSNYFGTRCTVRFTESIRIKQMRHRVRVGEIRNA